MHATRPVSTPRAAAPARRAATRAAAARREPEPTTRRDLVLNSIAAPILASLFTWGSSPRPSGLGVKTINGTQVLSLCPSTPNCISTAEEANDLSHYVPQWTFNPPGAKAKKTVAQAMEELATVVARETPDKFTPQIIEKTDTYLYAEYTSPTFGFIDDVEFLLKDNGEVEYRSASRIGESDGDINRKRIKALRKALEPLGWKSIAALG